jgi:lipoprotein-releasing system ATP-binding protein
VTLVEFSLIWSHLVHPIETAFHTEVHSMVSADAPVAALRVVDVRKSFSAPSGERIEVLRSVSFEVRAGEALAIMGASGSGKSTLLHLLGGLEDPDHGSITLLNEEISRLREEAIAEFRQRHIGFVFQFHYLLPDLSAAENVALPLLISRHSTTDANRQARALLIEMGLVERVSHPTSHLSGGEQQRVALARALITSPQLLLADEPTGNLDATIGEDIGKTLVNHVRARHGIAVIATHNESLAGLCDKVMLLEGGCVHPI